MRKTVILDNFPSNQQLADAFCKMLGHVEGAVCARCDKGNDEPISGIVYLTQIGYSTDAVTG